MSNTSRLMSCLVAAACWALALPAQSDPRTQGLDLSNYTQAVPWATLSEAGIRFAYLDGTRGLAPPHSTFPDRFAAAAEAGLLRVAAHTFTPDAPGAEQADWFLTHVRLRSGDLPPVINIASLASSQDDAALQREFAVFLTRIEKAYRRPVLLFVGEGDRDHVLGRFFEGRVLWRATDETTPLDEPRAFWHQASAAQASPGAPVPAAWYGGDRAALDQLVIPARLDQRPMPRPFAVHLASHRPQPRPDRIQ